ncbi:hypothetical protein TrRE_jg2157 [Triparma retinervis]|uniref:Mitochondrial carrier protein n=1 Tax=Triparma retinervis TaxID=2557542 RepID=A0A9W7AKQ6_9STRA|nr:hypothetical protein TrRE_jg2157 [Triparma retinervis]
MTNLRSSKIAGPNCVEVSKAASIPRPNGNRKTLSFTQQFMISFTSGCMSGGLSSVVCAPMDIIKTRMQVSGTLPEPMR